MDPVTVPVIPAPLQAMVISQHHDVPGAGHVGPDKTAARVQKVGYWVGMLRDIDQHCRECSVCQTSKLPLPPKAPLNSIPVGKPWEMVAIDILEVPRSYRNNRYLLVIQDYFTKWADAIPLPDQTAVRITNVLVKVFTEYGLPDIIHLDQGRNFESSILRQTLEAFGVAKSRTTAYHPQGDGMVKHFNYSPLQMLRAVQDQADWECHLPLVLYTYRTVVHTSTGVSPFELMYGRSPEKSPFPTSTAYDPSSYQSQLQAKLAKLHDFVETHFTEAAHRQRNSVGHRHRHDFSMLMIQYGYPFPLQESWILTGRESGGYMLFQDQWHMSSMMVQGTRQSMSIACDIAFSQTWKVPPFRQTQTITTPLGMLQQWSITSL